MNITRTGAAFAAAAMSATGLIGAATATAAPAPASASTATSSAATVCEQVWGSLPKSRSTMVAGPMTNIRSGRHTCYDRLVVDVRGAAAGYRVAYVSQIIQDGSGAVVPVRGGAKLQITINAPAYNDAGEATYQPPNPPEAVNVSGYQTLRQVRWRGSFEGASGIGVGVRARLPFRVFTLTDGGTSRVVIDVKHTW